MHLLQRELIVPPLTIAAIALAFVYRQDEVTVTTAPVPEVEEAAPIATRSRASLQVPDRTREVMMVFAAGRHSFVKLEDLEGGGPRHTKPRLVEDEDGGQIAVATIADDDVPARLASWRGKRVVIDGTCTATVTGFALASRLIGSPGYAYDDGEIREWTATNVLALGHRVIAARIDGCRGTYARDAALPAIVVPQEIEDSGLAKRARAALLASPAAAEVEHALQRDGYTPDWAAADFTIRSVRHPKTGETWVTAHATNHGTCGDPSAALWGVFRVDHGKLIATHTRSAGVGWSPGTLLDVDGDGELEVIAESWLGLTTTIEHVDSQERLAELSQQFYGCGC
jgi:hypothetical protein